MSVTKRTRSKNGNKNTFYHAEVYVRGVRVQDRTFETQAAAYAWHDKTKDQYLKGEQGQEPDEGLLFSEVVEKYLEFAKLRIRETTMQSYELRLTHFRASPLYQIKMRELTARAIDQWLEWLIKQPTAQNNGRRTFGKEVELLSVILQWYRNYVNANYVVPVTKGHRERAIYKPVKKRRVDYFVRLEDIRNWIDWLKGHRGPVYANLATFMVLTGTRVGEATGLLWDAVDFEHKVAHIFRTLTWCHHSKEPTLRESTKTADSNRIVKLPDELVQLLREMKLQSGGERMVFPGRKGGPIKYNAIQSSFNAGFVALNLPWRSTHICRHTYATIAYLATGNLTSVQASLGHAKREMTERYAKAVAHLSGETAEKTAAVFGLMNKGHSDHPERLREIKKAKG
jgi:integrase